MDAQRTFRYLVFRNIFLYVLWFLMPSLDPKFLSDDTLNATSWAGSGAILPLPKSVSWMLSALYVIAAIGVASFIPQARWLFVAITIFEYTWVLFGGVIAETALEGFISRANTLADGAIVALMFTPPVRGKFETPASEG